MRYSSWLRLLATAWLCAQSVAGPVRHGTKDPVLPLHIKLREERRTAWQAAHPVELPTKQANARKYFHEPAADDVYGHYDRRFFRGIVDYDSRADSLRHLTRSYLRFFAENGLETWIAHGTLLGWFWNGRKLPWDQDVDTQISDRTLAYLAQHKNFTTYLYDDPDYNITREYLLDINPYYTERDRGDGMNIIDARWIDVRNGLYIDITALSETMPDKYPGIWSCKNYHHYPTTDLYPMRESTFEGMPAKIPYAYDKILIEEYSEKALTLTGWEGHYWSAEKKEWIKFYDILPAQGRPSRPINTRPTEKRSVDVDDPALDVE